MIDMFYKKFQHNIDALIGNIPLSNIAVAISGGSDSIALLMLMNRWAKNKLINLVVMSVDHHLREQSTFEMQYVKDLSDKLGHSHFQLHWDHQNNYSNVQARAREGRYQLMTHLCHKLDILTILTAHHLDDYIENLYIRLERKSGIFGLSSSNVNWYNNVRILRPLFNIPKQQLIDYLIINNIKWFEDESNLSDKYQRNIIRRALAKQNKYFKDKTIFEQRKINQQVVENFQPQFIVSIAELVKIHDCGFATIHLSRLTEFSKEIKLQLINFVLIMISGNNHNVRSHSIVLILNLLQQKINFIKTLHGCIIKKIDTNLLVYREFGKNLPKNVILNQDTIWDGRFRFQSTMSLSSVLTKSKSIAQKCYVKKSKHDIHFYSSFVHAHKTPTEFTNPYITYLTMQDYSNIKKYLDLRRLRDLTYNNHISILFTLPTIKILEKLIAMPHISYYDSENLIKKFSVSFAPDFTSRFTHFC